MSLFEALNKAGLSPAEAPIEVVEEVTYPPTIEELRELRALEKARDRALASAWREVTYASWREPELRARLEKLSSWIRAFKPSLEEAQEASKRARRRHKAALCATRDAREFAFNAKWNARQALQAKREAKRAVYRASYSESGDDSMYGDGCNWWGGND